MTVFLQGIENSQILHCGIAIFKTAFKYKLYAIHLMQPQQILNLGIKINRAGTGRSRANWKARHQVTKVDREASTVTSLLFISLAVEGDRRFELCVWMGYKLFFFRKKRCSIHNKRKPRVTTFICRQGRFFFKRYEAEVRGRLLPSKFETSQKRLPKAVHRRALAHSLWVCSCGRLRL